MGLEEVGDGGRGGLRMAEWADGGWRVAEVGGCEWREADWGGEGLKNSPNPQKSKVVFGILICNIPT